MKESMVNTHTVRWSLKTEASVGALNFTRSSYSSLDTSPLIQRSNALKFVGYATD